MIGRYQVHYLHQAKIEYDRLDGTQKIFVDKAIVRLMIYGMNCGQPLTGNLAGYRKLKNRKMGLRIVFGQGTTGPEIIEIIAIGKRDKLAVYQQAAQRIIPTKK